jgi:hypothetical protein
MGSRREPSVLRVQGESGRRGVIGSSSSSATNTNTASTADIVGFTVD